MEELPSLARQKAFIIENGSILDYETKKSIFRIINVEFNSQNPELNLQKSIDIKSIILTNEATGDVSIDLDRIDNHPEIILHIYNIVKNLRARLSEPAS